MLFKEKSFKDRNTKVSSEENDMIIVRQTMEDCMAIFVLDGKESDDRYLLKRENYLLGKLSKKKDVKYKRCRNSNWKEKKTKVLHY